MDLIVAYLFIYILANPETLNMSDSFGFLLSIDPYFYLANQHGYLLPVPTSAEVLY